MASALGSPHPRLTGLWVASGVVLVGCLLSAFRLALAEDVALLLHANGARVLLAAGAGAALALAGALRRQDGRGRPLGELELMGVSSGAAGGGFAAVLALAGLPAPVAFGGGALVGAGLAYGAARACDRPTRWSNAAVALVLGTFVAAAALAGTYARAREDSVATIVAWLLGDFSHAALPGALAVLLAAVGLTGLGVRGAGAPAGQRTAGLPWLACGLGFGAAGLLAFVGSFVPRAVRALAPGAAPGAFVATSAVAGAATVAAIDAVPRLLVGGYSLPFNVGAGLLAVPVFLLWNRARLRRETGSAQRALEAAELVAIGLATASAAALVAFLTLVVRSAT